MSSSNKLYLGVRVFDEVKTRKQKTSPKTYKIINHENKIKIQAWKDKEKEKKSSIITIFFFFNPIGVRIRHSQNRSVADLPISWLQKNPPLRPRNPNAHRHQVPPRHRSLGVLRRRFLQSHPIQPFRHPPSPSRSPLRWGLRRRLRSPPNRLLLARLECSSRARQLRHEHRRNPIRQADSMSRGFDRAKEDGIFELGVPGSACSEMAAGVSRTEQMRWWLGGEAEEGRGIVGEFIGREQEWWDCEGKWGCWSGVEDGIGGEERESEV